MVGFNYESLILGLGIELLWNIVLSIVLFRDEKIEKEFLERGNSKNKYKMWENYLVGVAILKRFWVKLLNIYIIVREVTVRNENIIGGRYLFVYLII